MPALFLRSAAVQDWGRWIVQTTRQHHQTCRCTPKQPNSGTHCLIIGMGEVNTQQSKHERRATVLGTVHPRKLPKGSSDIKKRRWGMLGQAVVFHPFILLMLSTACNA